MSERVIVNPAEVSAEIGRSLHAFNASKELAWSWNSGENIIMYGPGGYGKSEAAILFTQHLKQVGAVASDPYILSFGQGMTEEKLLGGLDLKKFQEEGEISYLLKNAFTSHEVVIFEEMWDAFPSVLLILKDILTSKEVRMGAQRTPIKTKMVIACTNRSRDEVVEDNSTAALMERFVFEKEVCWESWLTSDYLGALSKSNKFSPELVEKVAKICASSSEGEYKISPRTAFKALKAANVNGVESLEGFYGFSEGVKNFKEKDQLQKKITDQADRLRSVYNELKTSPSEMRSALKTLKHVKHMRIEFLKASEIEVFDTNSELLSLIKDKYTEFEKAWIFHAKSLIHLPKGQEPKGWIRALLNYDGQFLDDLNTLLNLIRI